MPPRALTYALLVYSVALAACCAAASGHALAGGHAPSAVLFGLSAVFAFGCAGIFAYALEAPARRRRHHP